jgi:HAMP domain-containing protein
VQQHCNKEQTVAALQGLKLITAKQKTALNPLQHRRHKLVGRIDEQLALAQAAAEQRSYIKQRVRSVKNEQGIRSTVVTPVRLRPWWWQQEGGKLALVIRYGSKILALSPKSNAVECAALADVIQALKVVKAAVEAGELDAQITAASEKLREGFTA